MSSFFDQSRVKAAIVANYFWAWAKVIVEELSQAIRDLNGERPALRSDAGMKYWRCETPTWVLRPIRTDRESSSLRFAAVLRVTGIHLTISVGGIR